LRDMQEKRRASEIEFFADRHEIAKLL